MALMFSRSKAEGEALDVDMLNPESERGERTDDSESDREEVLFNDQLERAARELEEKKAKAKEERTPEFGQDKNQQARGESGQQVQGNAAQNGSELRGQGEKGRWGWMAAYGKEDDEGGYELHARGKGNQGGTGDAGYQRPAAAPGNPGPSKASDGRDERCGEQQRREQVNHGQYQAGRVQASGGKGAGKQGGEGYGRHEGEPVNHGQNQVADGWAVRHGASGGLLNSMASSASGIGHLARGLISPARSDISGIDGSDLTHDDFNYDSQEEYGGQVPKVVDDAEGRRQGIASRSPSFGSDNLFDGLCNGSAGGGAGGQASSASSAPTQPYCNTLADRCSKVSQGGRQRIGGGGTAGGFRTTAQIEARAARDEAKRVKLQREQEERSSQALDYLLGYSKSLDGNESACPDNNCPRTANIHAIDSRTRESADILQTGLSSATIHF